MKLSLVPLTFTAVTEGMKLDWFLLRPLACVASQLPGLSSTYKDGEEAGDVASVTLDPDGLSSTPVSATHRPRDK